MEQIDSTVEAFPIISDRVVSVQVLSARALLCYYQRFYSTKTTILLFAIAPDSATITTSITISIINFSDWAVAIIATITIAMATAMDTNAAATVAVVTKGKAIAAY